MALLQNHSIVSIMMIILLALMLLNVSESFEIRESDYEIHVKNNNNNNDNKGKTYVAHVIEQTDLVVKLKCTCTSWNKCDLKNMITLSK